MKSSQLIMLNSAFPTLPKHPTLAAVLGLGHFPLMLSSFQQWHLITGVEILNKAIPRDKLMGQQAEREGRENMNKTSLSHSEGF